MKLSSIFYSIICLFILIYSSIATARVEIEGSVSFQRQNNQVQIQIDRIANYSQSRTTGTLHVRLFARTSAEPFGQGYWLTDINLFGINNGTGQLQPNSSFTDLRLSGAWQDAPDGTYYIHMYITEHPNVTTALDTLTFDETLTFGSPIVPPVTPPPTSGNCLPEFSNCQITIENLQFNENGEMANFSYQIRNIQPFTSGQWFASFLLCDQPSGDTCNGNLYILGESQTMQILAANAVSEVVTETFDVSHLPVGTYYPIVQLYHYTGTCISEGYCVDYDTRYSQYINRFVLKVGESTPATLSSPEDGGAGSVFWLILFTAIAELSRKHTRKYR